MFKSFQRGPVDPMFILKKKADEDVSPEKADLGVGIYRNEAGLYSELDSVKQVRLSLSTRGHGS
jgi:aspartate aminotransferase